MWIGFQRPHDFSWGLWKELPVWQIAFCVAVMSNLLHGQLRLRFPTLLVVYLLLVSWIALSCSFAFLPTRSWWFFSTYMLPLALGPILTFAVIGDLKLLKWVLWVSAGGLGINALKTGLSLSLDGGAHITEQIQGFVGDNNVFGLTLCMAVGVLLGLRRTLPRRRSVHVLFSAALVFIVLTIIYTKSRGALLSLVLILGVGSVLSPRPIRNLAVLVLVCAITYLVVPDEYFLRLGTLADVSSDESAQGRLDNWALAWEAAVSHPFFGVGIGNHMPYHLANSAETHVRVAHSIYFQLLGEAGFPALILYLLFVTLALRTMYSTWRWARTIARDHPDLSWVRDVAFWLTCSYIGYLFGSALLNMLYIEFPWYAVFFACMLRPLTEAELRSRAAASRSSRGSVPRAANQLSVERA
jgi:probable O-glycosylation ligase (exosortase A-associated)